MPVAILLSVPSAVMATPVIHRGESVESIRAKVETAQQEAVRLDAHKHCGTIELDEDPRPFQRRLRDEWASAALNDAD